jgi:hypothetical protein
VNVRQDGESATPEILLEEFKSLRAEIVARQQVQGNFVAAALTIIAAIGGFALAKKEGRLEMLLVLPIVLSGLCMLLVDNISGTHRIGMYIRDELWDRLDESDHKGFRSWEHYVGTFREEKADRLTTYVALGTVPAVLIFVVPSVASLAIAWNTLNTDLWPLWVSGALALPVLAMLAWSLRKPPEPPVAPTDDVATAGISTGHTHGSRP